MDACWTFMLVQLVYFLLYFGFFYYLLFGFCYYLLFVSDMANQHIKCRNRDDLQKGLHRNLIIQHTC